MKNATQLYTKILVRTISHSDRDLQLAAIIALAEASIDNLTFQMKVKLIFVDSPSFVFVDFDYRKLREIGILPKLFDLIRKSDENSKLIAWICYAIVNICANCLPNIVLLRGERR